MTLTLKQKVEVVLRSASNYKMTTSQALELLGKKPSDLEIEKIEMPEFFKDIFKETP